MQEQNIYYSDLIEGKILRPLIIRKVEKEGLPVHEIHWKIWRTK